MEGMSNLRQDPRQWCEDLQAKLMAAIDAAWEAADNATDPAVAAKALARAKLCGQFAAAARKVAAIAPERPSAAAKSSASDPVTRAIDTVGALTSREEGPATQAQIARTALERLKAGGGRRGRL